MDGVRRRARSILEFVSYKGLVGVVNDVIIG